MTDPKGYFGKYGGRFVPETLVPALEELETAFEAFQKETDFQSELQALLKDYVGRPTPLYLAKRLSQDLGATIYLKREDLNHTGAHKINNALAQVLLAKFMGKTRIIAETGAGQHGVATATAAALLGFKAMIYMGEEDIQRQALNVQRMQLMGAKVIPVTTGSRTLKDATSEAIRDWMTHVKDTHYVIGSVVGPHPYPTMVREFQSVIGKEAKQQILDAHGKLPDQVIACVGGGSNAMGIFDAFIPEKTVELIAVEAAGKGLDTPETAAPLSIGSPGILHGSLSYLLQTHVGQIQLAHSISAGLDYPGVGPQLSGLKDSGRLRVTSITDDEALRGCRYLSEKEGIIPALETSHAIAYLQKASDIRSKTIILNVSGRGDKDMKTISSYVF